MGGDTEGKGAFLFEKREEEHERGEGDEEDNERGGEQPVIIGNRKVCNESGGSYGYCRGRGSGLGRPEELTGRGLIPEIIEH